MVYTNKDIKALFIHNPKCGGVYVRTILERYYEFKTIKEKHNDYNLFFDNESCIKIAEDIDAHTIRKYGKYRYFYSHQLMDKRAFDEYFSFTFVRNPYEKIYSAYCYLKKQLEMSGNIKIRNSFENKEYFTDFNTFIKNINNVNNISFFHAFITQYDQLIDYSNNIKINYVGRTENLDIDLIEILELIGIKDIKHMKLLFFDKRLNKTTDEMYNIAIEYNEESFQFVNNYFKKDFDIFGYKKYDSLDKFNNNYLKEKFMINNSDNSVFNKEVTLLNYHINFLENSINKYERIIDILIDSKQDYSNANEINNLKQEIDVMKKNIQGINTKRSNGIKKLYTESIQKKINSKQECVKCGFNALNTLAYDCHIKCCNNVK
jgi:hypothetical protein